MASNDPTKILTYGTGSQRELIGSGWTEGGTPFESYRLSDPVAPITSLSASRPAQRATGGGYSQPSQAMQWIPQAVKSSTTTATRAIGELPELPEYEELDEDKIRSRTQEFSALGRRIARSNFQDLLSRVYGATPDDPYAKGLARKASQGFSIDVQRAISEGGREALSVGLQEQQTRNQRQMTAYQAAVNAVLATATTTSTQKYEYAPTPMQSVPTGLTPTGSQRALSTRFSTDDRLSLGQPYTYG